jgi:putative copper export protein
LPSSVGEPALPKFSATLLVALVLGWSLALLSTLVGAVLQASASAGVGVLAALGPPLETLLLGTRYGALFWVRLTLLTLILGALILGRRYARVDKGPPPWWWAGLGASALLLLAASLSSHAAADPTSLVSTAADWLHLLAASVWVGGLFVLSLTLPRARGPRGPDTVVVARLVGRFSQVATVCVATLGVTGLYRALVEIADIDNLRDTAYGTALLIKLGLTVPLLALAGVNLLLIRRRLAQAASAPEQRAAGEPWYRRIRQTVGAEVLFVSAVLLVTSVLTSLPPAREAFGSGLVVRGESAGVRAVLVISPGEAGLNTFDAYLRDSSGRPIEDAEKVSLIFSSLDMGMGEAEAVAQNAGGGHYAVQGGYLSMSGNWQIQILVRRPGQDDVRITLLVRANAPVAASGTVSASSAGGAPALLPGVVLGIGLVVAGVIPVVGARRLGRARRRVGWTAAVGGLAVSALGVWVVANAYLATSAPEVKNPVVADAASLARGRQVYTGNCAVCHGISGLGDGPQAAILRPRPANLQVHLAGGGHSDAQLYDWVSNGIGGSAMPAFRGTLTEQERWDVINYVRGLASPTGASGQGPPGSPVLAPVVAPAAEAGSQASASPSDLAATVGMLFSSSR